MFSKITSIFTTASTTGVTLRYLTTIIGSLLAILGILGVLTPEQIKELQDQVTVLSANLPALLAAIGTLMTAVTAIYAVLTKSSSDKAAAVAKQVDAQVPAGDPVLIKTPAGKPDIVVPAKPA